MNKTAKIFLGILTFLPLLLFGGLLSFGIYQFIEIATSGEPFMPLLFLSYLSYALPFLFFYSIFYIGLAIFYVYHVLTNPILDTEKKSLWAVILIVLNGISMPAYWYIHIWKGRSLAQTHTNPAADYSHDAGTEPRKF